MDLVRVYSWNYALLCVYFKINNYIFSDAISKPPVEAICKHAHIAALQMSAGDRVKSGFFGDRNHLVSTWIKMNKFETQTKPDQIVSVYIPTYLYRSI